MIQMAWPMDSRVKRLNRNQPTERSGYIYVDRITNAMGAIWRRTPNDDYGFDGEIELVKNGEVSGHIIKVQVKSGVSYFGGRTSTSFDFVATEADMRYWVSSNVPVILLVYDPSKDLGYWKPVKHYLAAFPECHDTRRIKFSLRSDKFTRDSLLDVCEVAIPDEAERTEFLIDQIRETLHVNLLSVVSVPSLLYACDLSARRLAEQEDASHLGSVFEFNRYLAFRDPRQALPSIRHFLDLSTIREVPFPDYFLDGATRNAVIRRFNDALDQYASGLGLRVKYRGNFYFPPAPGGLERSVAWSPMRRASALRKVAYPYYGKKTGKLAFWVHHSCRVAFQEVGGEIFLRLVPGYVFTTDGEQPVAASDAGGLSTSRKSKDRNYQVLNHLFFWAWFLSTGQGTITIPVDASEVVIMASFVQGAARFGIPADGKSLIEIIESEHEVDWAELEAEASQSGEGEDE